MFLDFISNNKYTSCIIILGGKVRITVLVIGYDILVAWFEKS